MVRNNKKTPPTARKRLAETVAKMSQKYMEKQQQQRQQKKEKKQKNK